MKTLLDTVTVEPKLPAKHCVIWLHGLGADGHDFESIVPELHLPEALAVKFIFPHAPIQPVTLNGGLPMRAWFDIYGLDLTSKQDEAGISRAEALLTDLIETQVQAGITTDHIVLAGFSQGGALALHTALCYSHRLAGIMGLSTVLPLADKIEKEVKEANQDTPIFLAHGELDPVISINLGLMTYERLKELGFSTEWHEYVTEHSVCPDELQDISSWLQRVFKLKK